MSGATVAFVIFWSAVGGSTLLVLLAREIRHAAQRRPRPAPRPEPRGSAVPPLARRAARSTR